MSSARLAPGKAVLLMLGIGTASLIGLPAMSGYAPPRGALVGLVSDPAGVGVSDTPVALFDAATLALVEIAHTDEHGRFALQQAPERFHLCARPDASTELLPAWALDLERGPLFTIDLGLTPGVPIEVNVRDEEGRPIAGADVRCYGVAPGDCQVVARQRTDEHGRAALLAPVHGHVGVFGPDPELLPAWTFFATPASGDELSFDLPRGRRLHGRVATEDGRGLEGVVVSAWDQRAGWQWDGYRLTEADGAFALHAGAGTTELRALDRTQTFLPAHALAGPTPALDLVLASVEQVEVRCESADGGALPARVWAYSERAGTWGWGSPTDEQGRLFMAADAGLRAVARPLHSGSLDPTLWSEERGSAGELILRRAAGR